MLRCIQLPGPWSLDDVVTDAIKILYRLHDCLRARRCLIFWHGDHWRIGPPIECAGSPYTTTRSPDGLVGCYWHCLLLLADCLRAWRCLIFWHGDHWRNSPHQLGVLAGCHCQCHCQLPSAICHRGCASTRYAFFLLHTLHDHADLIRSAT